jgi:hypothetical protein
MKISEIVSENNDLNEAGIFTKMASAIPGVSSAMSSIANTLSKPDAIKNLAQTWANEILDHGSIRTTDPAQIEAIVGKKFANDPRVLKLAQSKAPALARELSVSQSAAQIGSQIGKGFEIFKSSAGKLLKFVKSIGLIAPFYQYYVHMSAYEQQLASNKMTEASFNERKLFEQGLLVDSIAAMLISGPIITKVLGAIPFVGPLLSALAPAATAAFYAWINTAEGRKALATLITAEGVEISGALYNKAKNALITAIKGSETADTSTDQSPEVPTDQSVEPSTSNKTQPAPKQSPTPSEKPKVSTPQIPDQGTWVDISPNVQKNTATGKTRIKAF